MSGQRRPPLWALVLISALVLVVSTGVLDALARLDLKAQASNEAVDLYNFRACARYYAPMSDPCHINQAGTTFTASEIICTADAIGKGFDTLAEDVYYEGHQVLHRTGQLYQVGGFEHEPYHHQVNADFSLGSDQPLPGGTWLCAITLHQHTVAATVHLQGPRAPILYGLTCSTEDTFTTLTGLTMCEQDQSGLSSGQPGIACTAVAVGLQGQQIDVHMDYGGSVLLPAFSRTKKTVATGYLADASIEVLDSDVGGESGISDGVYSCIWSINGLGVGTRSATVQY